MSLPEDVVISKGQYELVGAPGTTAEAIQITLPVAEASQLLKWLEYTNTAPLSDEQYQYFIAFKAKLQQEIRRA